MKKRIIDKRKKEKFMLDDEYLNGQAKLCGIYATGVYIVLCRHADKEQECFPSIKLMMDKLSIGRNSVLNGLKNLEERRVIEIKKTRSKGGQWLNNTYTLLDKSEWIYDQVPLRDMADQVPLRTPPSPSQGPDQVPLRDLKETHKQGNTYKETHNTCKSQICGNEINELLDIFYKSNPAINFGNKTQRTAIQWLIDSIGFEKVKTTISYAISVQGEQFAPVITTPVQLKNKLAQLKIFYTKQSNNPKSVTVI